MTEESLPPMPTRSHVIQVSKADDPDHLIWHIEHELRGFIAKMLRQMRSPSTRQDVLGAIIDLANALAELQSRDGNISKAADVISSVLDHSIENAVPADTEPCMVERRYAEQKVIDGSLRLLAGEISRATLQKTLGRKDLHDALLNWSEADAELREFRRRQRSLP